MIICLLLLYACVIMDIVVDVGELKCHICVSCYMYIHTMSKDAKYVCIYIVIHKALEACMYTVWLISTVWLIRTVWFDKYVCRL